MAKKSEAALGNARARNLLVSTLRQVCSNLLLALVDASGCAFVVVILDEVGSLVPCDACFPCLAIFFDLFCWSELTVRHMEACDFSTWLDNIFLGVWKPSSVLRVSYSSFLVVAKFIWNVNMAKAVGTTIHRHHTLNGASQGQLLVRMTCWSRLCYAAFFFSLEMAIELAAKKKSHKFFRWYDV